MADDDPCVTARLTWMQNYLLAEIIKAANYPPDVFYNIIRQYDIQPQWNDIPLPPGRCRRPRDRRAGTKPSRRRSNIRFQSLSVL